MNGTDDSAAQVAAPSAADIVKKPLSLLILLNQTFSKEQKQLILHKLNSSLNQINDPSLSSSYIVNVQDEINYLIQANQQDLYNYEQEYRLSSKSENFEFDLLINGTLATFKKALRAFLQSPTQIKSLIYAGYDHNSSANLVLQDALFSYDDFHLVLNDYITSSAEALKSTSFNFNFNSKYIHENQHWKHLEKLLKNSKFLTPVTSLSAEPETTLNNLTIHVSKYLNEQIITDLMEETKLTGTLNVEKPSLYIFPSREGDCAFFTFNGYSMLVNGGYDRVNPSFWRFGSMLKQIDSVLVTHQDSDALGGLSSFFAKKLVQPTVKPNILSVFGNLVKSKHHDHAHNDADVIVDAAEELKLKIQPLVKHETAHVKPHQQPEHINLYFKHGYGSLDMYVLSPFANSSEYKEFLHHTQAKVQSNVHKSHLNVNQTFKSIPVTHLCSAVVLLAWTPSKANENAVRILFTGNAPQHVIALALEKVKDFDLLQTPVYKIKVETAPVQVSHVIKKPSVKPVTAEKEKDKENAASAPAQNGNAVEKKPASKPEKAGLNTSTSGPTTKPTINGTSKPAATGSTASATGVTSKPSATKPATSTNGVGNKRESMAHSNAAAGGDAKKSDIAKKPAAAAAAAKEPKEAKDDHHKEEKETKKEAPKAAARPPAPKKDETKAKPEKAEASRVSTAPAASKSEHNTKATASTAASAPPKPRPSSAKPNTKPEKEEKPEKQEAKKPVASKPPAKPAAADSKPKPGAKDSKPSKPAANAAKEAKESKKEEKPVEEKPVEVKPVVAAEPPVAEACHVVYTTRQAEEPVILEACEVRQTSRPLEVLAQPTPTEIVAPAAVEPIVDQSEEPVEQIEQVDVQESHNVEEVELKQDIEMVLAQRVHEDEVVASDDAHNGYANEELVDNNEQEQEAEEVRREEVLDNKSEFHPSECAPLYPPNDECREVECCEVEKAEQYLNQNAEEEIEATHADLGSNEEDNHIPSDESPNLSPVKPSISKDSISSEDDVVVADEQTDEQQNEYEERCESPKPFVVEQEVEQQEQQQVLQEVEVEDQGCRRENLELCLDGATSNVDAPCVVDDPQQYIKTPQHSADNSPIEEIAPTDDVMTRSFIDNGENQNNPFLQPEQKETEPEISDEADVSQEISNDSTQDDGAVQELSEEPTNEQPADFNELINGFKSMNIQPQSELNGLLSNNHNGHHNGHHEETSETKPVEPKTDLLLDFESKPENNETEQQAQKSEKQTPTATNDPTTWNLLELPKPVNPNDGNSSTLVANGTDKKPQQTTPNPKRAPLSSSSPTASAQPKKETATETKPTAKASLNTSVNNKPASAAAAATTTTAAKPQSGPIKSTPIHPLYFEVSYIPAHGNAYYVDSDFFKRVRARFYILSTIDPSQHVLNALLEAKQTWDDKELQVSIIPTYESDTLRHWFMLNAEQLGKQKIDILPAANLTTLTIDDNPEFAYQVHKLEF